MFINLPVVGISFVKDVHEIGLQVSIMAMLQPTAYPRDVAIPRKHLSRTFRSGKMRRKKNKKVSLEKPEHQKYIT
jgi:hypothetical protein